MRSLILIILSLMILPSAQASQCDVFGRINEAGLSDNAEFWEDFAQLSAKGDVPETEVAKLMAKHKGQGKASSATNGSENTLGSNSPASSHTPKATLAGSQRVSVHKNAEKGYTSSPPQVQAKADELTKLFNEKGHEAIRDLHHHNWNYEHIKQLNQYSVRLSQGYRAMITVDGDKLTIWNISKHAYKH